MTINDILSHHKGLRDFYKENIPHCTLSEAGREPLKMYTLAKHPRRITLPSGKITDMCIALFLCCVESIEDKYRTRTKLTDDDRYYIAERMKEKFQDWSISDLKCFEDMLVMARIPTNKHGQVEYEMAGVSIPNLLGKAEAYDRIRPQSLKKDEADDNPDSMAALLQQELFGWRKSPFNIYDDYHKTHDCTGKLMVDPVSCGGTPMRKLDWDYESHWDQWFRTHKLGGEPAPPGFDPIAYWKTQPDLMYNLDEEAFVDQAIAKRQSLPKA